MSSAIPFLPQKNIESEAEALLEAYGERFGPVTKPPIPADEILNTHLRVTLDFDDLPKLLGVRTDVFGATWIERAQVIIDQSLDPTDHPERLGRYNFTVGHETGHWQLHRKFFLRDRDQGELFDEQRGPTVVCRTSQAKERIEWQADYFSSCFLMPKAMLWKAWRSNQERRVPVTLAELRVGARGRQDTDDAIIERFVTPLARDFGVSPIAMRIRLEKLGFVVREETLPLF